MSAGLIAGTFAATGQSDTFVPSMHGPGYERSWDLALSGTAVATVQLERSLDGGATWCAIYAGGTQLYVWSYNSVALSESGSEGVASALYRLNCTAYTSGTLAYRMAQ